MKIKRIFLYSGQIGQEPPFWNVLYAEHLVFRENFDLCTKLFSNHFIDFSDLLGKNAIRLIMEHDLYSQLFLFSYEYALTTLYLNFNVMPDVVIGHSFGEYVAAVISGVLSLEDAAQIVAKRILLLQKLPVNVSKMLAIKASLEDVTNFLIEFKKNNFLEESLSNFLVISNINSSKQVVVSGDLYNIHKFQTFLSERDVRSILLRPPFAYHSIFMNPIVSELNNYVEGVSLKEPSTIFISSCTGQLLRFMDFHYWGDHLSKSVNFAKALLLVKTIFDSVDIEFFEIGSSGSLLKFAKEMFDDSCMYKLLPDVVDINYAYKENNTVFLSTKTIEESLVKLCEYVLNSKPISLLDNFFSLGGDSFLAYSLLLKILEIWKVEISWADFFNFSNLQEVVSAIEKGLLEQTVDDLRWKISQRASLEKPELSFSQQRLWFLDQLMLSQSIYNIPLALDLSGDLNREALQKSLLSLVDRHEVLRTRFRGKDSSYQEILSLTEYHFSLREESLPSEQIVARLREEALKRFDLSEGPLWRASLLKVSEKDSSQHILLLTFHHSIADGWSLGIISRELSAYYNHYAHGQALALAELPIQYADYSVWQRDYLQGAVLEEQLSYWKGHLEGAPGSLDFPTDYPRPKELHYSGLRNNRKLEISISEQLRDLASKQRSTLFMVLLSAFKILLHRYSQQDDIVVGTVFANRYRQETQGLIGFFANTIALRSQISPEETFLSLLAKIRESSLLAQQYQDMPFEMLVNHLSLDKELNRNPLFQVMFIMQNNEQAKWDLEGLAVERLRVDYPVSKFDMTLEAFDRADGIHLSLEYSTELFKEGTIDRMMNHFERLLTSIVSYPEERIATLPMLSEEEVHQQLVTWNQTEKPYPQTTLHELFEQQVERTPDNVAIVFEDQQLTYRELNEKANQLARHLHQKYLEKRGAEFQADTPIAICVERSAEMLIGILAILKASGAYVAIDKNHPDERIEIILSDIDATFVLTESGFQSRLSSIKSDLDFIVISDGSSSSELQENLSPSYSTSGLAYIVYTSGSTGEPKGVMGTHQGMVNRLSWMWREYPFTETEICCHKTSLNFVDAMAEFFLPLLQGIRLHILNDTTIQDGRGLAAYVKRHSITRLVLVPSLLRALLDIKEDFSSIKILVVSGEALNQDLIEKVAQQAPHLTLLNLYGSSEVSADVTYTEVYSNHQIHSLGIGKPIDNMHVYVLDKDLRLMPRGVVGELYVSGVGLARGYWRQEKLTEERFIDNPFSRGSKLFKTGDLVRWNEASELEYLGRNDFQVKIRGQRIECGEIEYALVSFPSVKEAAVIAREDKGEKRLVGYVVKKDSAVTDEDIQEEIDAHLKEKLPEYMRPSVIMILEKLPLNINGKLDRKALPEPAFKYADYVAPENPIAARVIRLCERLVGKSGLGLEDNFFRSGGDSLKSISFLSAISDEFNVHIRLNDFFFFINLQEVVSAIEKGLLEQTVYDPRWKISQRASLEKPELSFSQQRLWFLDQLMLSQSIYNIPLALDLSGDLNREALQKSLLSLVDRHEVLRTRFRGKDSSYQEILSLTEYHFSLREESLPSEQIVARLREEALKRFDLSEGPLWRASLLKVSEKDSSQHILLLTFHHSIADGWSLGIISRELSAYYNHYAHGQALALAELPIQYADYSVWQRDYLQGAVLEEQLSYWKGHLEGAPGSLDFPTDYPRPKELHYSGLRNNRKLEISISEQLRDLASKQRSTLFMVLLSAFKILLHRYSQQDDIVVGTVFANRYRQETQGLIGFFANTIALRSQISPEETFLSLLAKIRESSLLAQQYQDMPFEMLVNHLSLDKELNRNPLFQVMFIMQNNEQAKWDLEGLAVERLRVDYPVSKFDMTLEAFDRADGIHLSLEYSTELFKEGTIDRMMNHFERLLTSIVSYPEERIATLPMLSEEEVHQQLVTWNQTEKPYPQTTLHELFEQQVERTPDNVAIVFEDQQLTYRELNEKANQLARHLHQKYLEKRGAEFQADTPIAICVERSAEMLIGILAILKASGAYVAIDKNHPDERIEIILSDIDATFVLTESGFQSRLSSIKSDLDFIVISDGSSSSELQENLSPSYSTSGLAYIVYTSGSTGEPKGVMGTHQGMVNRLSWMWREYPFTETEICCHKTSLNFVDAMAEFFLPLLQGIRLHILNDTTIQDGRGLAAYVKRHSITRLVLVPSLLRALLDIKEDFSSIKILVVSGEALNQDLIEKVAQQAPHLTLLNLYGSSEVSADVTYTEVYSNHQIHSLGIGKPIDNMHVYVLDKDLRLMPRGVVGELYVSGVGLARGYWRQEKLTEERFIDNPFSRGSKLFKTGDLVRWNEASELEYLGRNDFQVKIRGHRIECGEIEHVIALHAGIRESVVSVREHQGEACLVAYVVKKEESVADQDLRTQLEYLFKEKLPNYMHPATIIFLERLPLNLNGKIDRRALPDPVFNSRQVLYLPPNTEIEKRLVLLWSVLLNIPEKNISIINDFFKLGGHSIIIILLLSKVDEIYGVNLSILEFFMRPTILEMAVNIQLAHDKSWEKSTTPFHKMCGIGNIVNAEKLLNRLNNVHLLDSRGRTALHISIITQQVASIRFLLKKGIDINMRNQGGYTALDMAIIYQQRGIVFELISYFPKINNAKWFTHHQELLDMLNLYEKFISKISGENVNSKLKQWYLRALNENKPFYESFSQELWNISFSDEDIFNFICMFSERFLFERSADNQSHFRSHATLYAQSVARPGEKSSQEENSNEREKIDCGY